MGNFHIFNKCTNTVALINKNTVTLNLQLVHNSVAQGSLNCPDFTELIIELDCTREIHMPVWRGRHRVDQRVHQKGESGGAGPRHPAGVDLRRQEQRAEGAAEPGQGGDREREAEPQLARARVRLVLLVPHREHALLQGAIREDHRERRGAEGGHGPAQLRRQRPGLGLPVARRVGDGPGQRPAGAPHAARVRPVAGRGRAGGAHPGLRAGAGQAPHAAALHPPHPPRHRRGHPSEGRLHRVRPRDGEVLHVPLLHRLSNKS